MNKKEANIIARALWGATAGAARVHQPKPGNRFSVGFLTKTDDGYFMVQAGSGNSYEEAFESASKNDTAVEQTKLVNEIRQKRMQHKQEQANTKENK